MARSGITQAQVNEAADALLRGGERPTIERVRQALGTGSPNTLVRLLEEWWSDLGRRLDAQATRLTLPDAPEAVVAAASQLWLAAVEHAQDLARTALAEDVAVLASERAAMEERERQSGAELAAANAATQKALEFQANAETRLTDLDRLNHSLSRQRDDLQTQRDAAIAERDVVTSRLAEAHGTHEQAKREAVAERQTLEAQFRASENRWLQEVDRARQDASKTQTRLDHLETRYVKAMSELEARVAELQAGLAQAERAQIKAAATVEAQSTEIERLHAQLKENAGSRKLPKRKKRLNAEGKLSEPKARKPENESR
jgi:septal ring factor EnvC (AmiA/AmiB activator)